MNGIKKIALSLLSVLTIGAGVFGAACAGVDVNPNGSGGVTITPNDGNTASSQISETEQSEAPESSDTEESEVPESSTAEESEAPESSAPEQSESSESSEVCEHVWVGEVTTAAGCETVGVMTYTCQCGESYTEDIPATGHTPTAHVTPATCTAQGYTAYVCACGHATIGDYVPATGHAYYNMVCLVCSAPETNHQHVWGSWAVTQEPTCTADGEKIYYCETCDEIKTESIAMVAHTLTNHTAQSASCTEKGWFAYVTCETCEYTTYTELPATGHMYGAGVVSLHPTCTEKGQLKFSCYYCGDVHTEEIAATGHSYGRWTAVTAATCETDGVEERVCDFDSTHVETRTLRKTGHSYGEWTVTKNATCAEFGEEQRTCSNDTAHVESRAIPKTDNHDVAGDGICNVCRKTVKNRLITPVVQDAGDNISVAWNTVENAEYYLVHVLPNDEYVDVRVPEITLDNYFAGNKTLRISVQAVVEESDAYISSAWSNVFIYDIMGESIVSNERGVGDAVNLLTGGYTEFADRTTRIFDETLFSKLRLMEDTSVKSSYSTVTYEEGLESYLNRLSVNISAKMKKSSSAGISGIAKATAGFEFDVGAKYERARYGNTKSIFYDMDYYYVSNQKELYGDTDKLSSILSAEFLADARKVENGQMSAVAFIEKYGTHIVTAGIYGATFNAHYELLKHSDTENDTFKGNLQFSISKTISGAMKGIELGAETSGGLDVGAEYFTTNTTENLYSKFNVTARGGSAQGFSATSLEAVAAASGQWASGLNDENCVLIDVPDNSLYFVWDFLGEEYEQAKNILNEYFFARCDESYYALKDKISGLYSESAIFDAERGILTVNFAGLQSYTEPGAGLDISGISYNKETHGIDLNNGEMTIYSMINGVPVQKVIFKGSYYKTDNAGQIRQNYFNNLSIKFDQYWDRDILVEFDSFAYKAKAGQAALDFSAGTSSNICIIAEGQSKLLGNNSYGIYAPDKNVIWSGEGAALVIGDSDVSAIRANDADEKAEGFIYGNYLNIYKKESGERLSKTHYLFDGWYIDSSYMRAITQNDCISGQSVALYAKFVIINSYMDGANLDAIINQTSASERDISGVSWNAEKTWGISELINNGYTMFTIEVTYTVELHGDPTNIGFVIGTDTGKLSSNTEVKSGWNLQNTNSVSANTVLKDNWYVCGNGESGLRSETITYIGEINSLSGKYLNFWFEAYRNQTFDIEDYYKAKEFTFHITFSK